MADDGGMPKGIAIIIGIIVSLAIIVALFIEFSSGLNEFTPADACTDVGCAFDNPVGFCAINSSSEGSGISCPVTVRESLPLQSLIIVVLGLLFAVGIFTFLKGNLSKIGK